MSIDVDVLMLEDDKQYSAIVKSHCEKRGGTYSFTIHCAESLKEAIAVLDKHDCLVAIIDLALGNDTGLDAIQEIWKRDKKTIFIIHSISPVDAIQSWVSRVPIPHTSRFYLQKTASTRDAMNADAAQIRDLLSQAAACYVPYMEPTLISVSNTVMAVDTFWSSNRSFRRSAILANLHWSQDQINRFSRWASDRLCRPGLDTRLIGVVLVGSFARLEASGGSDGDFFVVFDDEGVSTTNIGGLIETSYETFLSAGRWLEGQGISAHGYDSDKKAPDKIVWHTTTLPTWFPKSSFLKARLGLDSQIELTKLWFLIEGCPIFNKQLFLKVRDSVCRSLALDETRSARHNVVHSELPAALSLFAKSISKRLRGRQRDELLIDVKHNLLRTTSVLGVHLFLLQAFLDEELFEQQGSIVINGLSLPPFEKLLRFHTFLLNKHPFGIRSDDYAAVLLDILNLYADGVQSLSDAPIRAALEGESALPTSLINDLTESGRACADKARRAMQMLASDPVVLSHHELTARRIVAWEL